MARPRSLPPDRELIKKFEQGWTHQDIADWANELLVAEGREPTATAGAVGQALRRAGKFRRGPYLETLPVEVRPAHMTQHWYRKLLAVGKIREGKKVSARQQALADDFLKWVDQTDGVISYGEEGAGFYPFKRPADIEKGTVFVPPSYFDDKE